MSADSPPTPETDGPDIPDRAEVISLLEDGISEAHRKVTAGRVRDAENEKVRQGWIRQLAYACGQYRQLKKDQDLEELAERVEQLEERQ
ncbi:hypothetical protein [Halalkalicoccus jeotgali]|uniref:DUF8136 domain-containing protein n=1 Tax=Halalkalicoccus jeotgali (strain DSM 18796 / CECT 7217 / JCM 14584 / KCTC 4019 / B3) TaxID=795797 RepID=D8JC49_HALJB|nr:hypothetical protein [Halalkalicoccus jeotgali]ADJ16956.1 hypothetical protein HacjB3_18068 [Halalkalicoccus jeotgali B3]ADJ16987.1 hypothetical protein HacjB3_18223 [Halalkalicoccus jeotgali B3]ELY38607.1 hypothetical protein C497_06694 [Halalkalicoccus jeotgali B3]